MSKLEKTSLKRMYKKLLKAQELISQAGDLLVRMSDVDEELQDYIDKADVKTQDALIRMDEMIDGRNV